MCDVFPLAFNFSSWNLQVKGLVWPELWLDEETPNETQWLVVCEVLVLLHLKSVYLIANC